MSFILVYALAYASKNLGSCMCSDILFLNGFPLTKFPMENFTFAIFVKDAPMLSVKHISKDISVIYFLKIFLKSLTIFNAVSRIFLGELEVCLVLTNQLFHANITSTIVPVLLGQKKDTFINWWEMSTRSFSCMLLAVYRCHLFLSRSLFSCQHYLQYSPRPQGTENCIRIQC